MNTIRKLLVDVFAKTAIVLTAFIVSLSLNNVKSVEAKVLDEILSYEITADVLEDASVDLVYTFRGRCLILIQRDRLSGCRLEYLTDTVILRKHLLLQLTA